MTSICKAHNLITANLYETKNKVQAFNNLEKLLDSLPNLLYEKIDFLIRDSNLTIDFIAKSMNVSTITLYNWRYKKVNINNANLLKFCLVLNLPPSVSLTLLKQNQFQFSDSKEDKFFELLLLNFYCLSIEEINEVLESHNLDVWLPK